MSEIYNVTIKVIDQTGDEVVSMNVFEVTQDQIDEQIIVLQSTFILCEVTEEMYKG